MLQWNQQDPLFWTWNSVLHQTDLIIWPVAHKKTKRDQPEKCKETTKHTQISYDINQEPSNVHLYVWA